MSEPINNEHERECPKCRWLGWSSMTKLNWNGMADIEPLWLCPWCKTPTEAHGVDDKPGLFKKLGEVKNEK